MNNCDNEKSADNQQERLITLGWIIGFVDGEGCFSCGIVRQQGRNNRRGYKTGYQVFHEFVVTQGERSIDSLRMMQRFFGVGKLYINKRYDNHKEHLYRYVVRNRVELSEVIIPFFRKHHLRTAKQQDFESFDQCMQIVSSGRHLSREGLIEILERSQEMNHKKSRQDLIRILRDYTPNIQNIG